VDEEKEEDEEEEEDEKEKEGEEVQAADQAAGVTASARPSSASGRLPGNGGVQHAQGDSPGGRRISGCGLLGDFADASGEVEDDAMASDGSNKNDESESDDVGGDVEKMEAILWGPTGT